MTKQIPSSIKPPRDFPRTKGDRKFIAEILSEVICSFGLGKEFLADEKKALTDVRKILKKNPQLVDEELVISIGLKSDLKKIKQLLEVNQSEIFYKSLFLSTFSLLEGVINTFLIDELEIEKKIKWKEAYELVHFLTFNNKFGVFLEILTKHRLDKGKSWEKILSAKRKRDFFIHLKPEKSKVLDKVGKISKKDVDELLEITFLINKKLGTFHSKKIKELKKTKQAVKKRLMK